MLAKQSKMCAPYVQISAIDNLPYRMIIIVPEHKSYTPLPLQWPG